MNKKTVKMFMPTLICMCLSIVMLITASLAWFSMNKTVKSSGMEISIDTIPSLVISDTVDNMKKLDTSDADKIFTYSWTATASKLAPATHYDSSVYTTVAGTNAVGLIYNTNPQKVVYGTGKGDGLTFSYVPTYTSGTRYYIDYTIYVASINKTMSKDTDYSQMTFTLEETSSTTNSAYKATSVDVYVSDSYYGTLNLDTKKTVTLSAGDTPATIPLNTSDSPIKVTFRCYFDGALQNSSDSTKNYINSSVISTNSDSVKFSVTIGLTDIEG